LAAIAPTSPPSPTAACIPDNQKAAIASYATELSKPYGFCLKQAQTELPGEDSETIRCAASSVFIGLQRKSNLT
jgi:hypothetical protein